MVASHEPPTEDLAHNPGICPDWESNQQLFGSQPGAQSTELYQPGPHNSFKMKWDNACGVLTQSMQYMQAAMLVMGGVALPAGPGLVTAKKYFIQVGTLLLVIVFSGVR